jgi:hypothetical protein
MDQILEQLSKLGLEPFFEFVEPAIGVEGGLEDTPILEMTAPKGVQRLELPKLQSTQGQIARTHIRGAQRSVLRKDWGQSSNSTARHHSVPSLFVRRSLALIGVGGAGAATPSRRSRLV